MSKQSNNNKRTNFWIWILVAIILVFTIYIGFWKLNMYWHKPPPTAAEFGDSFGAVNSLFSALAFAFLIVTALMQKKELQLQREELEETRNELKRTADAQESSLGMSKNQIIEQKRDNNYQLVSSMFKELRMDVINIALNDRSIIGSAAIDHYLFIHSKYKNAENQKIFEQLNHVNSILEYTLKQYESLVYTLFELEIDKDKLVRIAHLILSFYKTHFSNTQEYILDLYTINDLKTKTLNIDRFTPHHQLLISIISLNKRIEVYSDKITILRAEEVLNKVQ